MAQEKKPPKVVIVDDDEDLLKLMVFAFEAHEFEVVTFTLGKDALDYFLDDNQLQSTQLLILDRLLPDMDGLEVLKKLSKKYPNQMPLVLILSVLSAEKDVVKGLELGAIEYLAKPFSLEVLMDRTLALLLKYHRKA